MRTQGRTHTHARTHGTDPIVARAHAGARVRHAGIEGRHGGRRARSRVPAVRPTPAAATAPASDARSPRNRPRSDAGTVLCSRAPDPAQWHAGSGRQLRCTASSCVQAVLRPALALSSGSALTPVRGTISHEPARGCSWVCFREAILHEEPARSVWTRGW